MIHRHKGAHKLEIEAAMLTPTLSDKVIYVAKVDLQVERAAIVSCTLRALLGMGEMGKDLPAISSAMHVHLHVFAFSKTSPVYLDWDVPFSPTKEPGTWHWPVEQWNTAHD